MRKNATFFSNYLSKDIRGCARIVLLTRNGYPRSNVIQRTGHLHQMYYPRTRPIRLGSSSPDPGRGDDYEWAGAG